MKDQINTLRSKTDIQPPIAKKEATIHTKHGDVRIDDYYWMKLSDEQKIAKDPDQETKEVVQYLEAENTYREQMMSHLEPFQEMLFEEIKGRIKQDDASVPYLSNNYLYLTRYKTAMEYPVYSRVKASDDVASQITQLMSNPPNENEVVMLDVNEMASPYDYYNISSRTISPNNKILAYGEDTVSRRQYTLKFLDLSTGEHYSDTIPNTTGTAIWANDNKTIFYTRKDHTLRSFKIYKHKLGTPASEDIEVFHEQDDTFNAFVYKTKSSQFIVVGSWATLSQEYYVIDADHPDTEMTLFQARERNLEYSISHHNDRWYIRTNKDGAANFKIMSTSIDNTSAKYWEEYIEHRPTVFIEGIELFDDYLVINERVDGISKIYVKPWNEKGDYIEFAEEAYTSSVGMNMESATVILRIGYTSMTTPSSVYDYDMNSKSMILRKQQEVLGGFDVGKYESERLMVVARDGTSVPVSIVYKKGYQRDGTSPLLLYAYGSYGYSIDPYFSSVRLSLLNRGFAYAIAHIRGGQELGRQWYEDGKFLNKLNTFHDFIDIGEYLINSKYAAKDQLYAMGGSAGGMLMGGIANMRPDLWAGLVAAVPFVDVVTTMLDDSIPLTTGEYDEWGNPNEEVYYYYMKSYSPIDNVEAKDYPSMLITTGYHDSQVQYWEPAKWLAKLRDLKTDSNPIMMYCNMTTGHGGASGRFQKYKEVAMEYAYLLELAGKANHER